MKRMPVFSVLCALLFLLTLNASSWAAEVSPEAAQEPAFSAREQALQQVQNELQNPERRWYTITRLKWGYPLRWSAGIGAMLTEQPRDMDCATGCVIRGWHFQVEPGQYGIQGGVGWGRLVGETGRTKRWMHTANWGWAVRGVLLRTWGDSYLDPDSQTLAGIEGSLSIVRVNLSVGMLRSFSSEADPNWVLVGSFGLGF